MILTCCAIIDLLLCALTGCSYFFHKPGATQIAESCFAFQGRLERLLASRSLLMLLLIMERPWPLLLTSTRSCCTHLGVVGSCSLGVSLRALVLPVTFLFANHAYCLGTLGLQMTLLGDHQDTVPCRCVHDEHVNPVDGHITCVRVHQASMLDTTPGR